MSIEINKILTESEIAELADLYSKLYPTTGPKVDETGSPIKTQKTDITIFPGIINLRHFYSWIAEDIFMKVADEIKAELYAGKRYDKTQERHMYRYKAYYSLDVDNGIETAIIIHSSDDPADLIGKTENYCNLCQALNSLPEVQGRRIEAHYLLGKSQAEIARAEGVTKGAVSLSITKGLEAMKNYLKYFDEGAKLSPQKCQC